MNSGFPNAFSSMLEAGLTKIKGVVASLVCWRRISGKVQINFAANAGCLSGVVLLRIFRVTALARMVSWIHKESGAQQTRGNFDPLTLVTNPTPNAKVILPLPTSEDWLG